MDVRKLCGGLVAGAFVLSAPATELSFDFGGDFRLRQELMDNIPGNPGDAYAVSPVARGTNRNQLRLRPRLWFEAEGGPFRLYARLADEFREYFVENGQRRRDRAYTFPDEIFLDNLYLEGKGLECAWLSAIGAESVDFRFGRQDLMEGPHSVFGLDRILADGTPLDGSRSFFADMLRTRLNLGAARHLDAFALYCNGRNDLRWGNRQSDGRSMNPINMTDSSDLDEWGGGLVFSDAACEGALPFKVYSVFMRREAYRTRQAPARSHPAKEVSTVGVLLAPQLTDEWGLELEGARQFGRLLSGNRQAGGTMGYAGVVFRPLLLRKMDGTLSLSSTYYSGDRRRTGPSDNDTAWDPLWGRYTQDSEMLVYGGLYGNCYWSNVIYSKLKLTLSFGARHGLSVYTGPMHAAVQDRLGHASGAGDSLYKGWLTAARYDFPIRLAPADAAGTDAIDVFGHLVAEAFQPGDYFDSSKPAYFVRWQIDFRF